MPPALRASPALRKPPQAGAREGRGPFRPAAHRRRPVRGERLGTRGPRALTCRAAMAINQRGLQRIPFRQEKWYIQVKYCMIWDKSQWYASITQTQTASRSASDCRRMPLRTSLGSAVTGSCQIHRNGPEPGNGAGENRAGLHETVAGRPKGRLRARKRVDSEADQSLESMWNGTWMMTIS